MAPTWGNCPKPWKNVVLNGKTKEYHLYELAMNLMGGHFIAVSTKPKKLNHPFLLLNIIKPSFLEVQEIIPISNERRLVGGQRDPFQAPFPCGNQTVWTCIGHMGKTPKNIYQTLKNANICINYHIFYHISMSNILAYETCQANRPLLCPQ
jgi:hypothetical protein